MRKGRSIGVAVLVVVASLGFGACEDDPIIGPTGDEDTDGSYGLLHFGRSPGDGAPGGGAGAASGLRRANPRVF